MVNSFDSWETELYHHGIKGQKWGQRRFQNEDGSLTTAGRQHYGYGQELTRAGQKQYKKEYKKLQKLQDRANINLQAQKAEKYDKRARIAGKIGLAAAGVAGLGHFGGKALAGKYASQIRSRSNSLKALDAKKFSEIDHNWREMLKTDKEGAYNYANKAMNDWDQEFGRLHTENRNFAQSKRNIINGIDVAKKVATGVAVTSAGFYAYNKIQSHLSKKRMTEAGHSKAVQKAKAQADKIQKMFGDVKVSDIIKNKK